MTEQIDAPDRMVEQFTGKVTPPDDDEERDSYKEQLRWVGAWW